MSIIAEDSSIIVKTQELCAAIASDPTFLKLQESVERFLSDDAARLQYQSVHERGEDLHQKQHAGIQLGVTEIREFEAAREALLENGVVQEFLEAQQELDGLQKEIRKYVSLTLELGHVPTASDLAEANSGGGCCGGGGGGGGGCGCSH
ncbi:MAG: YlbF family regulator [Verrucomicrobiota bacterium]